MIRTVFTAFFALFVASAADASCPAEAPVIDSRVNLVEGDKLVNAAWLERNLAGRRVKYDVGTEHYEADGSYYYRAGSNRWDAPSYRFYKNGWRCIGYPTPRFDFYVVNDGRLVLINADGWRGVGRVLK